MECVQHTHRDVTEYIGGRCTEDGIEGGIGIPGLDSWLVGFSTDTEVTGLDTVPAKDRPPANTLLHWAFDYMVGVGSALIALGVWFGIAWWRKRDIPQTKWFLRAVAISGVATVLAMEAGWIVTEVGRQPWIVYEVMRTEDAVTGASGVWISSRSCSSSTPALGTATVIILRRMARRWREEGEESVGVPYGPPSEPAVKRRSRVSKADIAAAILWVGATLYAVFGGADFGAGFWSLVGGSGERAERARRLIDSAIGPVWEANHVWLIFILVVLWTAFSVAFEAVMSTLFIPLCLAALGIVLRGSGFAFHEVVKRPRERSFAEHLFAASSVITPFFMGTVVGAIAAGRVPVGNAAGDPWASWLNPVSILVGVLFVATGAYLAAVFLITDARHAGDEDLERYFSARALVAALVTGAIAVAGIFVLRDDARYVYDGSPPTPCRW